MFLIKCCLPCSGYLGVWEIFSSDIQPFTAYAPFLTVDGNHERDYAASGELPNYSAADMSHYSLYVLYEGLN